MRYFGLLLTLTLALILAACTNQEATEAPTAAEVTQEDVPAPEGRIVFQSNREGNFEIFMYIFESGEVERLTDNDVPDENPVVSLGGTLLAFQRLTDNNYDLYTWNFDEDSRPTQITNTTDLWETSLTFSPDILQIAYAADVDGQDDEIFIAKLDGSEARQITDNDVLDSHPSWSPDGERIIFQSARDGNNGLYFYILETDVVAPLIDEESEDFAPHWSPDGTHIAFVSNRSGNNEIYTLRMEDYELTRITHDEHDDTNPAWSPNSKWIVFQSDRAGSSDIWIVPAIGGEAQQLIDERTTNTNPFWTN